MVTLSFRIDRRLHKLASALFFVTVAGALSSTANGTEIATGVMLGPSYKPDRFYLRRGGQWEQTYSGGSFRGKARGRLMLLRLSNALFHDEWLTEEAFDPDENTAKVIAALDTYAAHGVRAIGISLQIEDPGYRKDANGISRGATAGAGKKNGTLASAFKPDGTLKQPWLKRLELLLNETNRRGMVVCLTYFGRSQDEVFESERELVAGARNMTDWLIEKNFRNVVIDVAHGWDVEPENWDHGSFVPEYIAHLLEDVRERFHNAAFTLPIGASGGGNMSYPASLAQLCDVVLMLGNDIAPDKKRIRLRELQSNVRPVWMIEDDNGSDSGPESLLREIGSADALFADGAGWGYRPSVEKHFPFAYAPAPASDFTAATSRAEREKAYFKAVLEHIAELVLKKPPHLRRKKR